MNLAQIEAALQAAFRECEIAGCPLSDTQKQILLEFLCDRLNPNLVDETTNPLDELTPKQRLALLEFIRTQEENNIPWKIALFNDWLNNRNSGSVQFIRDFYGFGWINRIKPVHLTKYFQQEGVEIGSKLEVGDRLEVCNALWEWVQEEGPCKREWVSCVIVSIFEATDGEFKYTNCLIRFENDTEFEIQGVYQWNRHNWRFPESS